MTISYYFLQFLSANNMPGIVDTVVIKLNTCITWRVGFFFTHNRLSLSEHSSIEYTRCGESFQELSEKKQAQTWKTILPMLYTAAYTRIGFEIEITPYPARD